MEEPQELTKYQQQAKLAELIASLERINEELKKLKMASTLQLLMPGKWYRVAMLVGIAQDACWVAEQITTDIRIALVASSDYPF